jgi:Zn-dependent peptidase ImmA (M78 family)
MKRQRLQFIETEVTGLLQESGILQAPVDVEKIARSLNIAIKRTPSEDDISGFLLVQANDQVVIGVNMLHHPNRQRFTIAHEIGHFMLHEIDEVHVDRAVVKLRDQRSSSGSHIDEVEANRFAAELLMPTEFLEDDLDKFFLVDLHDDRRMMQLAKRYQVSVQAMTNRVVSLGLLPELSISKPRH